MVDPAKAPHLCYFARINSCNILRFAEVGWQLRHLNQWMFGVSPPYFDPPPEAEREGITIVESPTRSRMSEGPMRR